MGTTRYYLLQGLMVGGGNRDRTGDLLHAMQALSQLSYTPEKRRNIKEGRRGCQRLFPLSTTVELVLFGLNRVYSIAFRTW